MKWNRDNILALQENIVKADQLGEQVDAAEESRDSDLMAGAYAAYDSAMEWLAVPCADFCRAVIDAFGPTELADRLATNAKERTQ